MLQPFTYAAPTSAPELYELLAQHAGKAHILAGGTDLLVEYHMGTPPAALVIDIKKIPEYRAVSFSAKEGLSIGAAVTCIEIIADRTINARYALLGHAAHQIGSPQLRNRATIGGNLCTASPCADMGCSLLALNASVELASHRGSRIIPLQDFFTGVKSTQVQNDEVLQRIIVPADMAGSRWGMEKLKRIKGHDLALVSVAMVRKGSVLRVGIGSCAPTPVALRDLPATATPDQVCAEAAQALKPITDLRASKEYRMFMVQEFIRRIMARMAE